MKRFISYVLTALYSLSTIAGISALAPVTVKAAEKAQTVKVQPTQAQVKSTPSSYNFVAQPGDSYSKIARKSVQIYGKKNKVKLSFAKIIAAETWLTQDADSPELAQGQKVTVTEVNVKAAVEKANKLSKDKEAAWAKYVTGVNFNTNNVGE